MTETITPRDAAQTRDAIRWAADAEATLELRGRGTKHSLGRPVSARAILDLSALAGVTLYEPEELVVTLGPGTPRAEAVATLAAKGQMLAFEPPDFGPLFGAPADADTIGGALGINAAGPRRLKAGAARDHILGVKGVSGFGDAFKSGGRVVKNVSGYDLAKLVTGSYGTLAAMTEVTLKALPKPDSEATLALAGLSVEDACAALRTAASHRAEPNGFALLPEGPAQACPGLGVSNGSGPIALIRFEGAPATLSARVMDLQAALPSAHAATLEPDASAAAWRAVRDLAPLGPPDDVPLWRISVPPSDAPATLAANPSAFAVLDWAGGLIWMSRPEPPTVSRGSVTLFRADATLRRLLPFLTEPHGALGGVVARVKASFDPKGVLNPGRMYEGL